MATWDDLRDLPLTIDSYSLKGFEQPFGPEFTRYTTVFRRWWTYPAGTFDWAQPRRGPPM